MLIYIWLGRFYDYCHLTVKLVLFFWIHILIEKFVSIKLNERIRIILKYIG